MIILTWQSEFCLAFVGFGFYNWNLAGPPVVMILMLVVNAYKAALYLWATEL